MSRQRKLVPVIGAGLAVAALAIVFFFAMHKSGPIITFVYMNAPFLLNAKLLASNVRTNYHDQELLMCSLNMLEYQRNPLAQGPARMLLADSNAYVWLNAADYLGALKDKESIPYLIKALRHRASRSRPERLRALSEMTGISYGKFEDWTNWWGARPLPEGFNWNTSLGPGVQFEDRDVSPSTK
jgi:hypothetical protein